MKWTRKQREAIEEEIKIYNKGIKAGFSDLYIGCQFPLDYSNACCYCAFCDISTCDVCPNAKISQMLGYPGEHCYFNLDYFRQHFDINTTEQHARFRRLMWKRALKLTKKEWLKIYKKKGKINENR